MMASLSARRRVFLLGLAVVALLLIAAMAAVFGPPGTRTLDPPIGVPVVIVPGYGGGAESVDTLAGALRAAGRQVRVVPGADSGRGRITDSVRLLDRQISRLGAPRVDLVGFSAGGVVVRLWAADADNRDRPRRIVTLGSPHHGTTLAAGISGLSPTDCVAACAELRPGSAVLRALNAADETPSSAAWASIWTENDETVVPPDSARLAGADNVRLQDVCEGARVSHSGLVTDPLPVTITVRFLATGATMGANC